MGNTSTVQQLPNGQIILNVPRAIAQAMNYHKGDIIEFQLHQGKIVLHKKK